MSHALTTIATILLLGFALAVMTITVAQGWNRITRTLRSINQ